MNTACIIVNYNDSITTINLLDRIKKFDSIDNIVVVDNCSTDNSLSELEKHRGQKIHVIQTKYNGGYGYGNNFGIRYAYDYLDTSYVLIANPDVEFDNQCIINLKNALFSNPECAIAAAREYNDKLLNAWKMPSVMEDIFSFGMILPKFFIKLHYSEDYIDGKENCYVDIVSGSLLLIDAVKMINYGMYDEEIFLYEEEKVLALKFKKNGYKTLLLVNSRYYHHHSVSISKTYKSFIRRKRLQFNSKIITLKKYRNLKNPVIFFIKAFFYLVLLETIIYSILKPIKNYKSKISREYSQKLIK